MSRDLSELIDKMLVEIPADMETLRRRLESNRESTRYSPPESMGFWWHEVANNLSEAIPEPHAGWERRVAEIFIGRPLDG